MVHHRVTIGKGRNYINLVVWRDYADNVTAHSTKSPANMDCALCLMEIVAEDFPAEPVI